MAYWCVCVLPLVGRGGELRSGSVAQAMSKVSLAGMSLLSYGRGIRRGENSGCVGAKPKAFQRFRLRNTGRPAQRKTPCAGAFAWR